MNKQVLVLNSGSSSIKFRLFQAHNHELSLSLKGMIEELGHKPSFKASIAEHNFFQELELSATHESALVFLLEWLKPHLDESLPLVVGHRVVHGGQNFTQPIIVDEHSLKELKQLNPLAPLHQPHNLAAIEALYQIDPELSQVACFDTAFHAGHAKEIEEFALPRELTALGLRRYGFHGLSYEFIAKKVPEVDSSLKNSKLIVAHLGNGASMCAIDNGKSIDSTMGFSALDGLVMGTRSGSIDAGVLLYLMNERHYDAKQLSDLLYKQSGLLGVSNLSNDMRDLLASDSIEAKEAIALYVQRIVKEFGALATVLQGIDGLVFTGGIGENAAAIRKMIVDKLRWLGFHLDNEKNQACHGEQALISTADSPLKVYVIPTNEELMIAQHSMELVD